MKNLRKKAFRLIVLFGVVSLLGDIIYEGSRGVNGQYLNILGAEAVKVGFVVGLGEFLGYLFRLFSGFFADKVRSYWFFTILGYAFLVSIPLISFAKSWQTVAFLIILERIGKGIRTPSRDTIVSSVAKEVGSGYGFGVVEFIDQIGAIVGPLIFTLFFTNAPPQQNLNHLYQRGYSFFWPPFFLLLAVLIFAYSNFKNTEGLESSTKKENNENLTKQFWLYVLFVFITTAGFVNFALVGFHLKKFKIFFDAYIPLLYAIAMATDAISGLLAGKVYDRLKKQSKNNGDEYFILLSIPFLASFVPFFVFSDKVFLIIFGIIFLGLVMGIQETIMKAAVADITPMRKRSSGYGIFNFAFGFAFFTGNALAGYLYDRSLNLLIITLIIAELMAIPIFFLMKKGNKKSF